MRLGLPKVRRFAVEVSQMYALFRINGFIMGGVGSPKCTQKNGRFTGEVWKEKRGRRGLAST